jgi:hypothetical protein
MEAEAGAWHDQAVAGPKKMLRPYCGEARIHSQIRKYCPLGRNVSVTDLIKNRIYS